MKEYWINVYQSLHGVWYGKAWPSRHQANARISKHTIYRLHVKLK